VLNEPPPVSRKIGREIESAPAPRFRSAPPFIDRPLAMLPSAESAVYSMAPPAIVVVPVYWLLCNSRSVPAPVLFKPPPPARETSRLWLVNVVLPGTAPGVVLTSSSAGPFSVIDPVPWMRARAGESKLIPASEMPEFSVTVPPANPLKLAVPPDEGKFGALVQFAPSVHDPPPRFSQVPLTCAEAGAARPASAHIAA
jgi:hypothetical protein